MLESAIQYIGVGIKVLKEQVTMQEFTNQRLGIYKQVLIYFLYILFLYYF